MSTAFRLADLGYDVWLGTNLITIGIFSNNMLLYAVLFLIGNARGNIYSRKHANINPSSEAYWKFSYAFFFILSLFRFRFGYNGQNSFRHNRWDQMGTFDIPSVVNYILTKTGRAKLSYIGYNNFGI